MSRSGTAIAAAVANTAPTATGRRPLISWKPGFPSPTVRSRRGRFSFSRLCDPPFACSHTR